MNADAKIVFAPRWNADLLTILKTSVLDRGIARGGNLHLDPIALRIEQGPVNIVDKCPELENAMMDVVWRDGALNVSGVGGEIDGVTPVRPTHF